ncbi:peptidoglycan recognition protein family protein [Membranihabitans maritimus]|uniref:peptidoglycan recognition protein family protein n=1 Tax=Membranihabitans maritimus TaxID=2904244 RepID=UPI001F21827B|nr:peptidoglycan recognition family protein [Membranihabitans maritimus]
MLKFYLYLVMIAGLSISGCERATFRIFDKPIVFDKTREELSLSYMKDRYGINKDFPSIDPKMVVVHWTAIPTLESSYNAMNPSLLPGARTGIASASSLNVGAHFLIDRDGVIFRQLPDTLFARHVIGLNHCAIGIENIGSSNNPLTRAQLRANTELIRYLKRLHPGIEYVIGHHQYREFENHNLWMEKDEGYRTEKSDPGDKFMEHLHKRIKDLGLRSRP